jgi:hypothetical protein
MAKRPKWVNDAIRALPEWQSEAFSPRTPVEARGFWLPWDGLRQHWIAAFEALDARGEKRPLIELLTSDQKLPKDMRTYLADLLDRHELKKSRGRQRIPAYDRSHAEALLEMAAMGVRNLVKSGESVKAALEIASEGSKIPLDILASAYRGSRGSTRRMRRYRP